MSNNEAKRIIEALLFSSSRPISPERLGEIIESEDTVALRATVNELNQEYEEQSHCFRIREVAEGFQIVTLAEYSPWIKKLFFARSSRLSHPSLETLAIIAYRQPVTRLDIEMIRGVNVEGPISTLLEKGLIKVSGRKETIGRPLLYGTTKRFLELFGLSSLGQLPKLEEFREEEIEVENVKDQESSPANRPD